MFKKILEKRRRTVYPTENFTQRYFKVNEVQTFPEISRQGLVGSSIRLVNHEFRLI